ncbi:MAG TPA: hypothetical protein VGR82_20645 [Methylomirabilota bacterium]|jgi:hypothetical protein|nr:hypothetical protein [Methylomirabilota bacterium]
MRLLLALVGVAALCAPAAAGDVYRWIDGDTVVYTDQPPQPGILLTAMPGTTEPPAVITGPDVPALADPPAVPNGEAMAVPPVAQRTGPASVEEILVLSGLRPQLSSIARGIGAEFLPRAGSVDPRDAAAIGRIVARNLAPDGMYAGIRDEFRRRVDARTLDAMAAWFRAPLGARITALEIAAAQPDAAAKVSAFSAGLKVTPPTAARLELVQRLDWVSGTADETLEIFAAITASFARAAVASLPAERRASAGLLERRVDETRGRMAPTVADNVQSQMLYIYAPLDDTELTQYVDFLASPAGRAYGRAAQGALLKVVREVADRTAMDIVRAVPIQRLTAQQSAGPTPPVAAPAR